MKIIPSPRVRLPIRRDHRSWLDRVFDWFNDLIDARFEIDADFDPKQDTREGYLRCVAIGVLAMLAAVMPW